MTNGRIVELRDPDGQYVTVLILEEGRGRILSANGSSVKVGDLLFLPEGETWESASEELGSFTRLGPDDLFHRPSPDEGEDPFITSIEEALDQDEEVVRETHARAERRPPPGSELPPGFSLLEEGDLSEGGEVDRFPERPRAQEEDAA